MKIEEGLQLALTFTPYSQRITEVLEINEATTERKFDCTVVIIRPVCDGGVFSPGQVNKQVR